MFYCLYCLTFLVKRKVLSVLLNHLIGQQKWFAKIHINMLQLRTCFVWEHFQVFFFYWKIFPVLFCVFTNNYMKWYCLLFPCFPIEREKKWKQEIKRKQSAFISKNRNSRWKTYFQTKQIVNVSAIRFVIAWTYVSPQINIFQVWTS